MTSANAREGRRDNRDRDRRGQAPLGERFSAMMAQRTRLPAYKMCDEIVNTIANNQITVISGDTGCGKSKCSNKHLLSDR